LYLVHLPVIDAVVSRAQLDWNGASVAALCGADYALSLVAAAMRRFSVRRHPRSPRMGSPTRLASTQVPDEDLAERLHFRIRRSV
jgi:hypothetical protein